MRTPPFSIHPCTKAIHRNKMTLSNTTSDTPSASRSSNYRCPHRCPCNPPTPPPPRHRLLTLQTAVTESPHPDKAHRGGEDASFIAPQAFGIFDGVGAWSEMGINAGIYAKALAAHVKKYVLKNGPCCIQEGLHSAAAHVTAEGSSTACVASLRRNALKGVNVGDSGLVVIRDRQIVFRTISRSHGFNYPYQLAYKDADRVEDGLQFEFDMRAGDIIIAATDGLWDNVSYRKILCFLLDNVPTCKKKRDLHTAQRVSLQLALYAKSKAKKTKGNTPFARAAKQAGVSHTGGKMDDTTVVISFVHTSSLIN